MSRQDSNRDLQEIGAANYAVLERIRVNRREDHLKVCESIALDVMMHTAVLEIVFRDYCKLKITSNKRER